MTGSGAPTALYSPTYAATVSLDPRASPLCSITTTSAIGNATLNAVTVGQVGQNWTILINNDATLARTITFGTNFRSSGTVTGTTSKAIAVEFVSDGTVWYEMGRSSAAV